MTKASPFSLARFEYEPVHLYYLPSKFKPLQEFKPAYVIGSRGTGKTTLLNSLNWEEQLTNMELKAQLRTSFVDRRYIGLYLRAPRFQCDKFESWLSPQDESIRAAIFSTYFDLAWLEVLSNALAELLARGALSAPTADEYLATRSALQRFPELVAGAPDIDDCSLKQLAAIMRNRREQLEDLALWKSPIDRDFLSRRYPLRHLGEFGRIVGTCLAEFCDRNTSSDDERPRKWHFKVCVDEAEYFSPFQRLVINSIVRLASVPVSYVVAYVRAPEDPSATLLPSMSLQEADRDIVPLDFMSDSEFQDLAEGAATVRIRHCVGEPVETFQTRSVLGDLDINRLLYGIISGSEKPRAKELLARAVALENSPFYRNRGTATDSSQAKRPTDPDQEPPPIYQAYIVDKLRLELPAPDSPRWKKRAQESAEIRKRMVAAYLCICADLKQSVRYGFADMLFQMSDKCVRDYLSQMNEIFVDFGSPLPEFLTSTVPLARQDRALKAAGNRKRDFLPQSGISSPREAAALVDGLAGLTERLQAMPDSQTALKSSERGVFTVALASIPEDRKWLVRLIAEAAEAGYLKILSDEGRQLEFRVHCSLAAAYGFSYRGAYYKVPIGHDDLHAIVRCPPDRKERANLLAKLAQTLDKANVSMMPLFEA
jgi:hypothetical protein